MSMDTAQAVASKKYGMKFEGDVPLSVSDTPAKKLGKRQVTKEWRQFFALSRILCDQDAAKDSAMRERIDRLNAKVNALQDENRSLERVMIERGLEIVGVSQKDRQFALPAAD